MTEQTYRTAALMLLLAFLLVWGSNWLRVRRSGGIYYSGREGVAFALFSRVCVVASLAGVIVFVVTPVGISWSQVELPRALRAAGLVVGGLGIAFLQWVLVALGQNFSTSLVIKDKHTLVTRGPYRWIRHPMYSAFCATFLGLALLSSSWLVAATAALGFGGTMLLRTPREEAMMLEQFGDAYRTYIGRTGRFLPKLAA
jgi:protein-S-isoprenylcysteine O-methyltransferase Ste14